MRSNGLLPALLAALLVPSAALAQGAPPGAAAEGDEAGARPQSAAEPVEAAATTPAATDTAARSGPDEGAGAGQAAAEPAGAPSGDPQHTDSQQADPQQADSQQADSQQADSQQADSQHTDSQQADPGLGESQATGQPPGVQPGEAQPDEAQPTDAPAADAARANAAEQADAEQAFGDIYGEYADPTLPDAAVLPGTYDPWEGYNRRMHRFNNAVDRRVARPLARGYVRAVPRPVRLGVSNFFNNLSQPLTMVNSLLQGKPKQAGQALGRFLLNSTFGVAGLFDPASRANLPQKSEDFGQTLGVWGWKRSRYFELPFFGPRTVRDVFGMAGDAPLSPLRQVEADRVRMPLQGLQLVDVRAQLLSTDSLREGAEDDYALVRDAWSQRRDYQIFGDRRTGDGEGLPDYLHEEEDSTVPVDAMPVTVPGNG